MYVHLYSLDTWGLIEEKISEKDIEVTEIELKEIINKQNNGFYMNIKNKNADNISDLFEIIEIIKPVQSPSWQERVELIEKIILEGL